MPSSAVRDIRYDDETHTLWLTFVPTGNRYAYKRVPPEVYEDLEAASSKGGFFNAHIRDRYDYDLVNPDA